MRVLLPEVRRVSQGDTIASTARQAVTANWATDVAGWCSRFVRQVLQRTGVKGDLWGGNAIQTEDKWQAAGLTRSLAQIGGAAGLKPGDVLFQGFGSGGDGHTAIYLGNGMIAENTTQGQGGKRISTLDGFGRITSVGRVDSYPDPYSAYPAGVPVRVGGLPTPFTAGTPAVGAPRLVIGGTSAGGTAPQQEQQGGLLDRLNPFSGVEGVWEDIKRGTVTYGADVLAVAGGVLLAILGGMAALSSE